MNYFELYPGDYLRDTTRLTLVEHGAYLRLLMAYYAEETPLPGDHSELFVIVSAVSAADKAAVKKVADRFFPLGEDGLRHNSRADEEIIKAQKRIQVARQNGAKGGRKPNPPENPEDNPTGIPPDNPSGNPTGYARDNPAGTQRGTHSGEALHTPHAIHQEKQKQTEASTHAEGARDDSPPTPTEEGRACLLMRKAGCVQTNPSHPDLLAAIAEGVPPEALAHTAAEAVRLGRTNPFTWAITTARNRHAEGPKPIGGSHANSPQSSPRSAVERVAAANAAAKSRGEESGGLPPIEGTVRVIAP